MKRSKGSKEARQRLVKLAFKDQKAAADEIRAMADALEACKGSSDVAFALSEIFCLSERTIFFDFVAYN